MTYCGTKNEVESCCKGGEKKETGKNTVRRTVEWQKSSNGFVKWQPRKVKTPMDDDNSPFQIFHHHHHHHHHYCHCLHDHCHVTVINIVTVIFIFIILSLPSIKSPTLLLVAENETLTYFRYLITKHILMGLGFKSSPPWSSLPLPLPYRQNLFSLMPAELSLQCVPIFSKQCTKSTTVETSNLLFQKPHFS
jgi:hypothetical protein